MRSPTPFPELDLHLLPGDTKQTQLNKTGAIIGFTIPKSISYSTQLDHEPSSRVQIRCLLGGTLMTAQVEFFCSNGEERDVLEYLSSHRDLHVFEVKKRRMAQLNPFSIGDLPTWPRRLVLYLWQPGHGPLVWHTARPNAVGATHGSLVSNLFAHLAWDREGLGEGDRMLDTDLSPIVCYYRGEFHDGKMGPCSLGRWRSASKTR